VLWRFECEQSEVDVPGLESPGNDTRGEGRHMSQISRERVHVQTEFFFDLENRVAVWVSNGRNYVQTDLFLALTRKTGAAVGGGKGGVTGEFTYRQRCVSG